MKSLWLVVLVCVCLLVATGCVPAATPAPPPTPAPPTPVPPTPAPDLVAPVKAWADAINKGDVDAALAPLADDVTWLADKPFNRLDSTGAREEFRENFDWLAGMEAKYQIKDCQPQDGGMRCTVSVGDGCIAASGRADGLTGQLAFTYQPDGKVRKAVLTIDDPRVQDYARFSGASDAWVLVNRPEEWGKIDYGSRAGGAAMVKLCQEYAESLKAPPTPADPVAPVKAWVDAMNNGDVDAALALFTDDAKLLMGALLFASGKNEVRAMLDADVGRETQYLIKDCQPAEDRVECAISFVDACTAASGVKDGLPMKMVFTLRDGKIGQSVMASEGGEQAIYDLWEHKMEIWAKANRAEEWAQYVAKGETREGESIYAKLCQEYAESLKAPPTPAADLVAPVKAWVAAINSGDVDAALALFTDDATQVGMFTAAGKEQLRGVFDYLVGQGAQFGVPDCQPKGDGVTCSFTVFNDCFAASGAKDPFPMTGQYVLEPGGKIRQLRMDAQVNKAWEDWGEWYSNFKAWASAEDWAKSVAHTKEGGATAIKLCQEYAESLK